MANNRINLRCTICDWARTNRPMAVFGLVKYYPSQGWYINRSWWQRLFFGRDLDRWLDDHRHDKTLFGTHIVPEQEVGEDE